MALRLCVLWPGIRASPGGHFRTVEHYCTCHLTTVDMSGPAFPVSALLEVLWSWQTLTDPSAFSESNS